MLQDVIFICAADEQIVKDPQRPAAAAEGLAAALVTLKVAVTGHSCPVWLLRNYDNKKPSLIMMAAIFLKGYKMSLKFPLIKSELQGHADHQYLPLSCEREGI